MSIATVIKDKAEATRDDVLAKAEDVVTRGTRALGTAEGKAEDMAKNATDAALTEISALVATLNDKITELGLDSTSLTQKARSSYADIETFVTREVSDRPVRALAVVGLAGLALGLLTRK